MQSALVTTHSNRFVHLPDETLVLQQFRYRSPITFPPHIHDEYSVVVCIRGQILAEQRGVCQTLYAGETLITSPGVLHGSSYALDGEETAGLSISLHWSFLRHLQEQLNPRGLQDHRIPVFLGKQQWDDLLAYARTICEECDERRPGYASIAQGLAHRLVSEAVQRWPRALTSLQATHSAQPLERWRFVVAVEELGRSVRWQDVLARLSRQLSMDPEEIRYRFESSVGMPLAECSRHLVVRAVQHELQHGEQDLSALAARLGFRSVNHLVGNVRSVTKTSPRAIRQTASSLAKRNGSQPDGI